MVAQWSETTELACWVEGQSAKCLASYRENPILVEQDAGIEISSIEGGYGRKQLHELAQNGADALIGHSGRIAMVLSETHLYCANEGEALSPRGLEAVMASHLSIKRDDQIGRFGLGFKSVLGISDAPEIISRTGAIRFDRSVAEHRIREIKPRAERTSVLRVGEPFNPIQAAGQDATLRDLMSWATTVVRLPLKEGSGWLAAALGRFPPEFLLFAPHVTRLDLQGRTNESSASWTSRRDHDRVVLKTDRGKEDEWQLFRETYIPSSDARKDAGEISGRDEVTVTWAVPLKARKRAGRFWAYFPTNSTTTLSGIVNAPFKTNEDRHDILDGIYNREILTFVLPPLVSQNLKSLLDPIDPCSLLEILPARGREIRSWADDALNEPVMQAVAAQACLPDMDGCLQPPDEMNLAPEFLAERSRWVEQWTGTPGRPSDWVHPSVNNDSERRAKAVRLLAIKDRKPVGVGPWLNDLAAKAGPAGSGCAILLARLIELHEADYQVEMRQTPFILSAANTLQIPITGRVFLPDSAADEGQQFVHQLLAADPQVSKALKDLGIGRMDQLGKLQAVVEQVKQRPTDETTVAQLWQLTRHLRPEDVVRVLEGAFGSAKTPVRTRSGRSAPVGDVLLPGAIVSSSGARDSDLTIDTAFHADDLSVLSYLGALAEPRVGQPRQWEQWYTEWLAEATAAYLTKAKGYGKRTSAGQISIDQGRTFSRLDILPLLSLEARLAFTDVVLSAAREEWAVDTISHVLAEPLPFTNPGLWWIRKHGAVQTAYGPQPVADAFAPGPGMPADILPVADLGPELVRDLALKNSPEDGDWTSILASANSRLELADLHRLYGLAAVYGARPPEHIKVYWPSGEIMVAPGDCVVTYDPGHYQALIAIGYLAVFTADQETATALREHWGLGDSSGLVNRTVLAAPSGEAVALIDQFPGLTAVSSNVPDAIELVPCSDLAIEIDTADDDGGATTSQSIVREDRTIYHRDNLSPQTLLELIDVELRLGMSGADLKTVQEIADRHASNNKTIAARKAVTFEEKILALAGETAVRRLVPPMAVEIVEQRSGRKIAPPDLVRMARASHGSQLLRKLAPAIQEAGFVMPTQLAGGMPAREWVRNFGLPDELAGEQDSRPPAREEFLGPVDLPGLHDYQALSIDRLCRLLQSGGRRRGLISLPTGSGKTRVAVEAVVRHIKETGAAPLILWIAQTDELCEQAVETWSYVWRAIGVPSSHLTLSRLWGPNSAGPIDGGAHLVVAIDDKLDSVRQRGGYEWLTDADIVIVDEAHTSVSKTYTSLFNWLRRGTRQRDLPLIGLSATPYRGTNEDQTNQLVNRYDSYLVTEGVFGDEDPHLYLQERRILAKVRHLELEGTRLVPANASVELSTAVPRLQDYRIDLDMVAADEDRNTRILDSLENLPSDMTALVFAASVQHAETLAAVLNIEGVPAASVSAYSPQAERRRIVQQFRNGEIRVVTNYNVLSQGFDAPKVGAVFVARPTFSLNRYQQMIGRGLRGPLNGGSEEVLIVNIRDNIDAFGEQLAFHHFDELWRREAASV